ncbi:MAG: SAM-dependent methyltransferase [Proteobacteria bacterium SG_bin9]|nr:MAG: SAM-dependent methyltransferase [Proteobacteria bacterium SG_bin9]
MSSDLPPHLKRSLERLTEGVARTDMARRAETISRNYRDGGGSGAIRDARDALAYALARMPATYAAVSASLEAAAELAGDFAPTSLLDIGAGPGTATWAAAEAFPSLSQFAMIDANAALRSFALDLARGNERFKQLTYRQADAQIETRVAAEADLVVASYAIGEMEETGQRKLVEAMWAKTRGLLVIVEPGTPAGYDRVIAARAQLIAAGAHIVAPCPHQMPCPLEKPDWCHFAQRLARSRDHKQLKSADAPFEDEKFSYVALSRAPLDAGPRARVLAAPSMSKAGIMMKLCIPDGRTAFTVTPRRDKEAYARDRRLRWGDALSF